MLPLLVGVVVGAAGVVAYNNRKEIKTKAIEVKDTVVKTAKDVKTSVTKTVECIGDKKETKKEVQNAK